MAKPEMGARWVCAGCETRFFDFGRPRATCPSCGVEQPRRQRLSTAVRAGGVRWGGRGGAAAPAAAAVAELPELVEAEVEVEDDEEEDDVSVEDDDDDELPGDIVPPAVEA